MVNFEFKLKGRNTYLEQSCLPHTHLRHSFDIVGPLVVHSSTIHINAALHNNDNTSLMLCMQGIHSVTCHCQGNTRRHKLQLQQNYTSSGVLNNER